MIAVRVGIDIVPLARVTAILGADPEVLQRHLVAPEIDDAYRDGKIDKACVAGKLAGKEAVFKLFRRPGAVLPWRAIHISTSAAGWPIAALSGSAAAWATEVALTNIDLNIAHDSSYAIAAATGYIDATPRKMHQKLKETP